MKPTKSVKAWAAITQKGDFILADAGRECLVIAQMIEPQAFVVPCTITYKLPSLPRRKKV